MIFVAAGRVDPIGVKLLLDLLQFMCPIPPSFESIDDAMLLLQCVHHRFDVRCVVLCCGSHLGAFVHVRIPPGVQSSGTGCEIKRVALTEDE